MIGESSQLTISITSSHESVLHKNSKTTSLASINNGNNSINNNYNNNNVDNSINSTGSYNNNNINDDVNNSDSNNNNNKDNKYNNSSYSSNNNSKKLVLKQHYYTSSEASIPVILPITKSTPNKAPSNHHHNHQTIEIKPQRANTGVTVNTNELIGE